MDTVTSAALPGPCRLARTPPAGAVDKSRARLAAGERAAAAELCDRFGNELYGPPDPWLGSG